MNHLRDRKNRLSFATNSTARYRSREREIVMEVFPEYAAVRLLGTRTRYEVSWRAIFELAAENSRAERTRAQVRKNIEKTYESAGWLA